MSNEVFLMLLMVVSVLVSLTTEALKKALSGKEVSNNLLVGVPAIALSVIIGVCYCIITSTPITQVTIIYIIALVFMSWLCSMLGYDKVMQTIKQMKG